MLSISLAKVLSVSYVIFIIPFVRHKIRGRKLRVVSCDVSKLFDRVWHEGFLLKFEAAGISGSLLTWLCSYLLFDIKFQTGISNLF